MKNQYADAARHRPGDRLADQHPGSRKSSKYYDEHKNEFVREEQVFLRQILISTEGKTPEQVAAAEKKAKDLVARARKGEKFGGTGARQFRRSGDRRNVRRAAALQARRPAQGDRGRSSSSRTRAMSPTRSRSRNGFLILRVEERYAGRTGQLEEVKNEITERLAMPQMQPKVREYLTQAAAGGLPRDPRRLRGQRRRARQGHQLDRIRHS